MTGVEFYATFKNKANASYTSFVDATKANRIFREALIKSTDRKYLTLDEQKTFDEISAIITTEQVFSINNNKIFTAPISITNITFGGGLATFTTLFPHNLVTGDSVTISGVLGLTPNPNGVFTVIVTSTTTFTIVFVLPIGTYTAGSGQIVFSKLVSDYGHFYSVRCKFTELQIGLYVTNTAGASPIGLTFNQRNKFRNSSVIQLQNMTATPAANGVFYYRKDTNNKGRLYTDEDLTIPSTGGVTSTISQGTINYIWYNEAKEKFADRNIDPYQEATVELPLFETADKFLKFYPANKICSQITLSYFKNLTVFIDARDNTFDLSLVYPEKYQSFIMDIALRIYSIPARDILLTQESNQEVASNP